MYTNEMYAQTEVIEGLKVLMLLGAPHATGLGHWAMLPMATAQPRSDAASGTGHHLEQAARNAAGTINIFGKKNASCSLQLCIRGC
jgi:hypothetical protein